MTDPGVPGPAGPQAAASDEGNLALLVGAGAALLGGAAWAIIVMVTNYEVGYVAWGVGGLVGFAMSRTTARRGRSLAMTAAGFAMMGLLFGKVLILQFVTRPALEEEFRADQLGMARAAAWELRENGAFPPGIQARLDSMQESDTLPDALWEEMVQAGRAHAESLPPPEQDRLREMWLTRATAYIGFWRQLGWQFTIWDVLWFGLALTTAWGMLAREAAPAEASAG